ncbi:hypothetical protein BYT27DRAFT_7183624 [Phlegmacium glaucopus]|nr:hypothetical protein BYT27DRAFT_7183618 [Phlegmacium glaucopus]KAF8811805.1 hypothetical protein BYT27DRAFT_7183624 [Phlegmacium glaucopus]
MESLSPWSWSLIFLSLVTAPAHWALFNNILWQFGHHNQQPHSRLRLIIASA